MHFFEELSGRFQDSLESDSNSKESQDDRLYSFKWQFAFRGRFLDSISSIFISIRIDIRASEGKQTHPNRSNWVRTGQNMLENLKKLVKLFEKLREKF